jgi:hypothetical protein
MAAVSYDPDTLVIEVPEERTSSRRTTRRIGTEVDVHVLVEGHWHKRTPDHALTSCGAHRLHSQFHSVRHPVLLGRLCEQCFTAFERGIAESANADELKKVT